MAGSLEPLYFVIDGPPGPEAGRFVDVETIEGENRAAGLEWTQRGGRWLLGPFVGLVAELDTFDDVFLAERGCAPWSEPSRPHRVLISTAEPRPLVGLPALLVADVDYVVTVGGILKDRDGRFRGRNPSGDVVLHELALDGGVEYVRWPK